MSPPQPLSKFYFERVNTPILTGAILVALLYLLWCWQLIGIRSDHFYLVGLTTILYFAHPVSRKLFWMFVPFLLYVFIYDSLRVFPNYDFNEVNIAQPYLLEKSWFGMTTAMGDITPNEYFAQNTSSFLNVISGLFYLSWVPIPIVFGGYLFFTHRRKVGLNFWLVFLLVNLIGFSIYYLYPAAPPWYVDAHGFEFKLGTLGSAAGLSRFDEFFGLPLFHGIYSKNASIFAAIPSMHAAYPMILVYFAWTNKMKLLTVFFVIQTAGIWFSAVYTMHHYIIDLLVGMVCAVVGIILFEQLARSNFFRKWETNYLQKVN